MRTTVKVFAIVGIVLGSLAMLGGITNEDIAALIGGGMFLAWGIVDLNYIKDKD